MAVDFSRIRCLSFDCYGTLIDWQSGILAALGPALALARQCREISDSEIIRAFAAAERVAERPPYRSYKRVLEDVAAQLYALIAPGHSATDHEREVLWRSIPDWPAFPDTAAALRALQSRFKIAIVSNIDDDLFASTRPRLGIEPDFVITAEQVCSYKPGRAHFDELQLRTRLSASQILHVGESRFHDVEPAAALGFPTVWVNRTGDSPSASGVPVAGTAATHTVWSMTELASMMTR